MEYVMEFHLCGALSTVSIGSVVIPILHYYESQMNHLHMIRRLDAKHQRLSQKLNAISDRSTDHAAGGETEAFDVFSITDTEAINERLKDHCSIFNIERNGKEIKVVKRQGGRIGITKVYLTIRESGDTPKLFMVEDDAKTTKAYDVTLTRNYFLAFDRLENSSLLNGGRYYIIASQAVSNAEYKEPAVGSTYTCLTDNPYVTIYKEDIWG